MSDHSRNQRDDRAERRGRKRDDNDDDEPRRRRRVKKKSGSPAVPLLLGGGVLLIGVIGGVVIVVGGVGLTMYFLLAPREMPVPKGPIQAAKIEQPAEKKVPRKGQGGLVRQRDLLTYRPYFKQIALAYSTIVADRGKGPNSKEDFRKQLQSQKIMELFDQGHIEFYYGVSPQQMEMGASNTIVGYEPVMDGNGLRLVIMGDGTVQEMNEAEYAKAARAKN